ncbi:MAG: glycosyltransferase, partial [Gemmatimonadota bacterium]|nr:glycosyltransferase [Gemmatimonadota bacterium]
MGYNILLINWRDIAHPEAGGAEVHAHEIFSRIVRLGHRVTWLCATWPGCEPEAEIDGIEILRRGRNMTFNFAVPGILRGELASRKFDIIVDDENKIPFCTPRLSPLPRLILFHHLFGA